jgi:hypothetical protein
MSEASTSDDDEMMPIDDDSGPSESLPADPRGGPRAPFGSSEAGGRSNSDLLNSPCDRTTFAFGFVVSCPSCPPPKKRSNVVRTVGEATGRSFQTSLPRRQALVLRVRRRNGDVQQRGGRNGRLMRCAARFGWPPDSFGTLIRWQLATIRFEYARLACSRCHNVVFDFLGRWPAWFAGRSATLCRRTLQRPELEANCRAFRQPFRRPVLPSLAEPHPPPIDTHTHTRKHTPRA